MARLTKIVGELQWTPPPWLARIGAGRLSIGLAAAAGVVALGIGIVRYYESLPQPPGIVAQVSVPGITPIVDDTLRPLPLVVDFSVQSDPRFPVHTVGSIARIDRVGETLDAGATLDPAMPGTWRWETETRLVFEPTRDWPAGQRYALRFDESLFAPGLSLRHDQVQFTTHPLGAAVDALEYYQNPVDRNERRIVATLSFTHPVDAAALDSALSLTMRASDETIAQPPRTLARTIEFAGHGRMAYVHSEQVPIPPHENYATLTIDESLAPASGRSRIGADIRQTVRIPDAETYFNVSAMQSLITRGEGDAPFQTVTMEFTDRVSREALESGLVAYLLPEQVRINGQEHSNMYWSSPREVTPEVLSQSGEIAIALNPVEGDASDYHTATLDVPENRYVYLRIAAGLESEGGFALNRPYDQVLYIPEYPREAKVAMPGAILPLTGRRELTLLSRGVKTLKVEIGRVIEGEVNHLASQSGGDFRSPYFQSYSFNEDNLTVRTERLIDVQPGHPRDAVYASVDFGEFTDGGGYYFLRLQGWDRENDQPVGGFDRRLVLITDLGLLVKANADSSQEIFVHSIRSGEPVAGANVALLGKNGVAVFERTTSADGRASMPAVSDFEREQAPTVFVVRNGRDAVFMPFGAGDRDLPFTRFDVGGVYENPDREEDRLRALVFTDRGLYRPGETVRLAAIVRRLDWLPPGDLPLVFEVSDPRGQRIVEKRLRLPADGFLDQAVATQAASPTGNYVATLQLIDEHGGRRTIGSDSFRVEEFQPDRLRIDTRIVGQKPQGWIRPGDLVAEVALRNLFGTPAQSRQVTGELELVPSAVHVPSFPDHRFDDPLYDEANVLPHVTLPLDPATTGDDGVARLPLPLAPYDKGIYRLVVNTEGFEEGGGRGVKARASVMMSPLDFLVGYRADTDLAFINRAAEHEVHFVAVDSDAKPVPMDGLTLSVVEERYVSTLVRRPDGTYAYQSILQEDARSSEPFAIAADGSRYALPTGEPGRYAVVLSGEDGLVYSRLRFAVAGARNLAGELERDAELDLVMNGTSFAPGEEIEFEITAPYTGTGLITIERDRVYAHQWFRSDTPTSVQRIRVPEGLEGNAYLNVAFVRAIDSPEVYVSPLSYAVAPFSIDANARTVDIGIDAPDLVRPGEALRMSVTASRDARVVVYAVDEGILQVANYAEPDPLGFFLPKMALQVGTTQLVDLILPDFDAWQRRAAPGGGEGAGLAGSNLNPFRRKSEAPVAFWSGIVDAGPAPSTVGFTVPDYFNGEVRIMAVAASDTAVGSAADKTTVRGPFVITPNVLTAAAPGDEFYVNVGLANNVEGSGPGAEVVLSVRPSANLEIVGDDTVRVPIDEGGESRASFRVRAKDEPGAGSLLFEARAAGESTRRTATLSVRPPVAYVSTMLAGASDDDPIELTLARELYPHHAEQSAAASRSPLVLADGMLDYLQVFPHACTEQLVSKVFPQLGFLGQPGAAIDEAGIRGQFLGTLERLRSRQMADGSFRFWATSTEPHEFASVYITHFMSDAQGFGLAVPEDMLGSGLGYLRELAGRQTGSLNDARLRAYAIYVLTRNGTITTNYLTNLHEWLNARPDDAWERDITAAYMAASYALLQQVVLGRRLIGEYEAGAGDEMTHDFDTRLGRDAQYVYLLARHFPERIGTIGAEQIQALVAPVMQNRFNTLSAAYTILALTAWTQAVEAGSPPPTLTIAATAAGGGAGRELASSSGVVRASVDAALRQLMIQGAAGDDIYYVVSQTGFDRVAPADAIANGLELHRDYLDDEDKAVSAAGIGDELTVRLRVRSTGAARSNVAVVDLLPGGFEVLSESIRDQYGGWNLEHRDVREDRVVIYGTFTDRITEIRYRVKLTSAGDFVVPGAHAGSMYDRSIRSRTAPGRFRVSPLQ